MSYYDDATERIEFYHIALEMGRYKFCVALCCEIADRLLKQKVEDIDVTSDLLQSHDFVGMYKFICSKYPSKVDLSKSVLNRADACTARFCPVMQSGHCF